MAVTISELLKGAWNSATTYYPGDRVTLNGSSYECILSHTNQTPPNATYWQLIASKGDTGATGATGPQGDAGEQGNKGGIRYNFSTNTTDSDPTQGIFKYNNGTIGSVTQIFIDLLEVGGVDLTDFLDALDASTNTIKGHVVIQSNDNADATLNIFEITGVTTASGYRKIDVNYVLGALPSNAEECILTFTLAGNKGIDGGGAGDVVGPASATNNAVVVFDGTTGKLIKDGEKSLPSGDVVGTTDSQTLTNKTITSPTITDPSLSTFATLSLPVGTLVNGRISVSVNSNNLTLALKGLNGSDPSPTNPVYIRIEDTVRAITGSLSVTTNAGTNWFGSGGADFATRERDYFAYIGYNDTDGVVIGFSPINHARTYADFSTTNTNEKFCAISTITNATSSDSYTVVGRFAATLSASASFNWSVPTFTTTNLIQKPIYETRSLTSGITFTGFSVAPTGVFSYKLVSDICFVNYVDATGGTSNATTFTATLPFAPSSSIAGFMPIFFKNNGVNSATTGHLQSSASSRVVGAYTSFFQGAWASSNGKDFYFSGLNYRI